MPDWLAPLLAGSSAIVALWVALGIQRLAERRGDWARRFVHELRHWDGRLPDSFD